MGRMREKVVTGYVVKRETKHTDPSTHAVTKVRVEVSRIYHSLDAAQTFMALAKKTNPDWDLYIHEKKKNAEVA